jgi:L-lactate dehydrogenase complex protein LldG
VSADARTIVLQRVASAAAGAHAPLSVPRRYRRSGALQHEERVELFCRRAGEYRADVRRLHARDAPAACAEICAAKGVRRLVVPRGLPTAWRPGRVELVEDAGLSPHELDATDGALTGCTLAIAETGTIILTAGPAEGRRAISLVPDLHVCVVSEGQIVELVPEAFTTLADRGLARRPITLISGPSATSDIELSRVEGVHGPRNLFVLVLQEVS